jgi:hypothetical protein
VSTRREKDLLDLAFPRHDLELDDEMTELYLEWVVPRPPRRRRRLRDILRGRWG